MEALHRFHGSEQGMPEGPISLAAHRLDCGFHFWFDLFSFLDAYSRYHQIFMSKEDEENTSFINPCGTYCFVCMPFGLKSAGSTFARVVQIGFEPQMHRNI